jgi:hypothetical protein
MTYSRHSSTHQVHTKTPVLSPKPAHSQLSHLSEMCLRNVLTNSERRPARTSMRSPPQRRAHARWQATSNKASPRSARTGMPKKRHGPQTLLPQGPGTQGTLAQKDLPHHVLQVCQRDLLQCQKRPITVSKDLPHYVLQVCPSMCVTQYPRSSLCFFLRLPTAYPYASICVYMFLHVFQASGPKPELKTLNSKPRSLIPKQHFTFGKGKRSRWGTDTIRYLTTRY